MTSRSQLDAFLSELRGYGPVCTAEPIDNSGYQLWEYFAGVAESGFNPLVAAKVDSWIWWTKWAQAAFDDEGNLSHPIILHWQGPRADLQLQATRFGFRPRFVSDEPYEPGFQADGLMVLCPAGPDQETDLSRLLEAFVALHELDGCVALPCTGLSHNEGWHDVEQARERPDQTVVFWHTQSHDFDDLGMLGDEVLHLNWSGDKLLLADRIRQYGFEVEVPKRRDKTLLVTSNHTAPTGIATLEEAQVHEKPLDPPRPQPTGTGPFTITARSDESYELGVLVSQLVFSPNDEQLWVIYGWSSGSWPTTPMLRADPASLKIQRTHEDISTLSAFCKGICWLDDGRLLVAWGKDTLRLDEAGADGNLHTIVEYPIKAVGHKLVDAAGDIIVLPTASGLDVRSIGPAGTQGPPPKPPTVISSASAPVKPKPAPPNSDQPWGIKVSIQPLDEDRLGYVSVAIAPDGRTIVLANETGRSVTAYDATGEKIWKTRVHAPHTPHFSADGRWLIVSVHWRGDRSFALIDPKDGSRPWSDIEDIIGFSRAIAVSPDGNLIAVGRENGELAILRRGGKLRAETPVFLHGPITALVFSQDGNLVVGSSRGELARVDCSPLLET